MKKFLKKNKWLITLVVTMASAATGINFLPVQNAIEETVNDSPEVRRSTNELGDSIVNDSICFTTDSLRYEK